MYVHLTSERVCVCMCVRASVCLCVRACMHACVRACVCACISSFQSVIATVQSGQQQYALMSTAVAVAFALAFFMPFIKRTGHTALVPCNR